MNKFRLFNTLAFVFAYTFAKAQVVTYPISAAAEQNNTFSVSVRQGNQTMSSPVYMVKVDKVENANHNVMPSSMTQFSFNGEIEVRVKYLKGKVDSARIRPLSYRIKPEIIGNEIVFKTNTPMNLSVEVNGDIYNNLQLFACPFEKDINKEITKLNGKNLKDKVIKCNLKDNCHGINTSKLIYFAPGVYDLDGDSIDIVSNTLVYVAGGAVLKGRLNVYDAENVKIMGRGIIDYNIKEGVRIRRSENVYVEGLAMTQLPIGNSRNICVDNVKVISYYGWGDGLNVFAASDINYKNCFARTSDDCHTVYASRKGFKGNARNISMSHCTLWADVAHPIFIGLHGNVEKPDTIENLRYKDIDILEQMEYQTDYQGCLAIGAGDLNLVRDVVFDNIRIENIKNGQLINLRTTYNKKYCMAPGRSIENITFKNIDYNGQKTNMSIICGYSPDNPVKDIVFENLRINGKIIYDGMPEKPKWYKTSDFANMYIGENVENVVFTNDHEANVADRK